MDFIDVRKVAVRGKMFTLLFFPFFFFGVKVYLSFWGLVQWKGDCVTEIMSFRNIWQGKKMKEYSHFVKT